MQRRKAMSDRSAAPLEVAMLLYPNFTLLDLAGPQAALGLHGRTHLVWKSMDPVTADSGISLLPTATFATCPTNLDVLFVPGGLGTNDLLEDAETIAFLQNRARTARYVTSVCTGSLLLAAAGLLEGRRAATHWTSYDMLDAMGVQGERSRVVVDGNCISGGGVTAGLDFGLTLLAHLCGEPTARMTQLILEYDPQPPFVSGTPHTAGPETTGMALGLMGGWLERGMKIAKSVGKRTPA
jgi:cyclohexyl-isocyanide hydratase